MNGTTETRLLLLTLEPKTLADAERMESGLRQLAAEDPTLSVETDRPTGTVTLGTIGELQLEIVVDRLRREFQVEAGVGKPEVAYKRASTKTADGTIATSPLLEPVMRVEVTMPPEFAGDVIQSLLARRGRLQSQDNPNDQRIVCALVPLAELFGFDCDLRQRTRGRGTFLQQFDSYQPVGVDPGATDDDRSARVGAPVKPVSPQKPSAIALPEPEDEGPEV
jgi:translation elongation factor EF-G